ncbi:DUF6753 family protein [Laspinema olomoucense]|uniref:DUF6753 family protein n=1 Tax=Laspinema olomoucense TaxID=3231600 RepID=UPI0021BAAE2A|nr:MULTISPECIES: DUF6753 family protein [unclassified Laspinema]MCT7975829.1 hypothetical protein [Laspinema sp. D3d]MCT7996568.1 hypothetical protein [Laspinema sp. D3c]
MDDKDILENEEIVENEMSSSDATISDTEILLKQFKEAVWERVRASGVSEDDPLFDILFSTVKLEVLLQIAPGALERQFGHWMDDANSFLNKVKCELEAYEDAAIQGQKSAIARTVRDLVKISDRASSQKFFTAIVPAAGVILVSMGIGVVLALAVPLLWNSGEEPDSTHLQTERLEANGIETLPKN